MKSRFKKQLYDFMSLSAANNIGELRIYGDITDERQHIDDISPQSIADAFDEMGAVSTLNIHIYSYGGSCMAGNAIVDIIDDYKRKTGAKVVAYIDGIAASMASGVAMAADYVYMAENAFFMVHKPYSVALGDSDDMMREAELLEKVENTLVKNYMRHFNGTEDEMRQLMADESWLNADEALEYGFCDEIVEPVRIAASAKGININGRDFIDEKVKNKFKGKETERDKVFEYDSKLADYGITEEVFNSLEVSAETIHMILNTFPMATLEATEVFITADMARETLGSDYNADVILSYAKTGMEIDTEASAKAKAYDKLVNAAIDDAITSGNRAKGESFNETKWKKILASLDYSEIIDQKLEWDAEAKIVNKAGMRVSQMRNSSRQQDKSAVNIDEFQYSGK